MTQSDTKRLVSKFFLILIGTLFFVVPKSYAQNQYDIKDLEVLEKNKNFSEFFIHAKDIRPSQRGEYWQKMVQNMAEGLGQKILNKSKIEDTDFALIERIVNWAELKTNDLFLSRRHKIALKYFNECFERGVARKFCRKQVNQYWEKTKSRPEWGIDLVKIIRNSDSLPLTQLWPYISPAVNHELSEFLCRRPIVSQLVIERLMQESAKTAYPNLKSKIVKLIHPLCWKSVRGQLLALIQAPFAASKRFAIKLLMAKGHFQSKREKDVLAVTYLLSDPTQGDLFNISWAILTQLRDDHRRREKVLQSFKQMDPIPDQSFASRSPVKAITIAKQIQLTFPELIDYYGQSCYGFVSGVQKFENGNPTVKCRDFIKQAQGKNLIRPHLEKKLIKLFQL